MAEVLAILLPFFAVVILVYEMKLRGTDAILGVFLFYSAYIVLVGYVLSGMNFLGDIWSWFFSGLVCFILVIVIFYKSILKLPSLKLSLERFLCIPRKIVSEKQIFEGTILILFFTTFAFSMVINFLVLVLVAPNNWDSMTYHLARVAYYLQHNNFNFFDANYWAQVVHPKNSSVLMLYTYLVSGRNENLTKAVQYLSYLAAIISLYGISRQLGFTRLTAILSACTGGLLTNWLMEATTNQNDLIITAYIGQTIYFLIKSLGKPQNKIYPLLAAFSLSLAMGTKASTLITLPALGFWLIGWFLNSCYPLRIKAEQIGYFLLFLLVGIFIFVIPSGYGENYFLYSNPFGPKEVTETHGFDGKSFYYVLKNGTKNIIRYSFEFLALDGFPVTPEIRRTQIIIKTLPKLLVVDMLDVDIDFPEGMRAPFRLFRMPIAHEDFSYWGVLGLGLLWPSVIITAFSPSASPKLKPFGFATIVFLIAQGFAGPYDPWRGRYFTTAAIFAIPTSALIFNSKRKFVRFYLLLITLLGCFSAIHGVLYKSNNNVLPISTSQGVIPSILSQSRLEQLSRNKPSFYSALHTFEQIVPPQAKVAVCLPPDSYEYPLFGKGLTRKIYPINSFLKGVLEIPPDSQYLLYSENCPFQSDEDILLGDGLFLKVLDYK